MKQHDELSNNPIKCKEVICRRHREREIIRRRKERKHFSSEALVGEGCDPPCLLALWVVDTATLLAAFNSTPIQTLTGSGVPERWGWGWSAPKALRTNEDLGRERKITSKQNVLFFKC
ncbi:hypothetical protein CEXT_165341 [Caerostris extrusa]|uniref:Uncharacterized protein n=1 Tax=Caerostris extrusa TaxID=172846 RepID=A0AAV4T7N7_CAEEX|nr:hypothetical protein CEXT_165341 [Caerostris extrusa]